LEKNVINLSRIRIEPAKQKKELTTDEIQKIREALKSKDAWMGVVFEITLNLGCRFNEARIPLSRVNFETKRIEIEDSKRKLHDSRKLYEAPLKDRFIEYLRGLKWEDGYSVPEFKKWSNQRFNEVLKSVCGISNGRLNPLE
jgi:hypothetical protein